MGRDQKVCCFGKCSCWIVCAKERWNPCDSDERSSVWIYAEIMNVYEQTRGCKNSLLSLAAVLRKHPLWFQNPTDIVFWNRNVCFLRTGRSKNPENKSVLFFIYPGLCRMQWFKSVKSVNPEYKRQNPKMKLREVCPLTSTNHKALNLLNSAVIS